MLVTVKNKTPHPFDIPASDGNKILPALGEIEIDMAPEYIDIFKSAGTVEISPVDRKNYKQKQKPLGK